MYNCNIDWGKLPISKLGKFAHILKIGTILGMEIFFPRAKKLEMKKFWPGWDRFGHPGDDYGGDYPDDDDDDDDDCPDDDDDESQDNDKKDNDCARLAG